MFEVIFVEQGLKQLQLVYHIAVEFSFYRNHFCEGDSNSGSCAGKNSMVSSTSPKQGGKREEGWKEVVRK